MRNPQPTAGDNAVYVILTTFEVHFLAIRIQLFQTHKEIQIIPFIRGDPELQFYMAGNFEANSIAKWHKREHKWETFDKGVTSGTDIYGRNIPGIVYAITVPGIDEFWVGGNFSKTGDIDRGNLGYYINGWQDISLTPNNTVMAMGFRGANLFIGGFFDTLGFGWVVDPMMVKEMKLDQLKGDHIVNNSLIKILENLFDNPLR